MEKATNEQARARLLLLASGHIVSKALFCAAELGIADELSNGPMDAEALARRLACSPDHLQRLMLALSTVGVFKYEDGKFKQSQLSQCLRREERESVWSVASFFGDELYKAIDNLPETIRTGRPCWDKTFGVPVWQYFAANPGRGTVFDRAMSSTSPQDLVAILQTYDFSDCKAIVDVGGGDGFILTGILERYSSATGILFDLEDVVSRARAALANHPAYSRCKFIGGDFFAQVPFGGTIHVLRRILHDWRDDDAVRILRACRAGLDRDGRVLVIEKLLDGPRSNSSSSWSDIGMMVFGGRERTADEYAHLLKSAGFRLERVIPTPGTIKLLEAVIDAP